MKFPRIVATLATIFVYRASGDDVRHEFREPCMGCEWTLRVEGVDGDTAPEAAAAVFARLHELDRILSDYRGDSELSRLSGAAGTGRAVPVSDDLWTFLVLSQEAAEQSDGAFDVTVGPCSRLWRRSRRQSRLPAPEALSAALAATGWRKLELRPGERSVVLAVPGMRLDPGGIAKGWALDEAFRILRDRFGITSAMLDAGGQVRVGDPPPGRDAWHVALRPMDGGEAETVRVRNCSVSTSGDAWQYAEIDGRRYSHILDPATGLGLTRRIQVTAIAKSGALADWLGTAVAVMGPEKGMEWANRFHPESGVRITVAGDEGIRVFENPAWAAVQREAAINSANSRKK